jgi:hypothetical protein
MGGPAVAHAKQLTTAEEDNRWRVAKKILGVALFYSVGCLYGWLGNGWTLAQSCYFTTATVTTVGYGDYAPKTELMKVCDIFFVCAGVTLVGQAINDFSNELIEIQKKRFAELDEEAVSKGRAAQRFTRVCMASFSEIVAIVALSTVFFKYNEGWSWVDAFYWSIVTITTVGYGDLTPTKETSRMFSAVYMVLAVVVVAYSMGKISLILMDMKVNK